MAFEALEPRTQTPPNGEDENPNKCIELENIAMDAWAQELMMDLSWAMCGVIVVHILLLPYTLKTTPNNKHWVDMLDLYFHLLYVPVLVVCSVHTVYVLGDDVETRLS